MGSEKFICSTDALRSGGANMGVDVNGKGDLNKRSVRRQADMCSCLSADADAVQAAVFKTASCF